MEASWNDPSTSSFEAGSNVSGISASKSLSDGDHLYHPPLGL
jgi:hypothetical protein